MCLGIPGRIIETHDDRSTPMATVDFGGASKTVCLAFAPDSEIDDWVIVHAGFAIATLDEAAAQPRGATVRGAKALPCRW